MNSYIFKANGILWSSCRDYYVDIMLELEKKYKVDRVIIYNLEHEYRNFIIDCYKHDEDVMSDGYIDDKVKRLLEDDNTIVVGFTLSINNPEYRYGARNNLQCIQARNIKEIIRQNFSKKIYNYFLDNIIHLSDNEQESNILEVLFTKYQNYAIKRYLLSECKHDFSSLSNKNNGIEIG